MNKLFMIIFLSIIISACGMPNGKSGPYKGYLLLKSSNQKIVSFYLGSYEALSQCISVVQYEVNNANAGKYFWTNPDYSYGGMKRDNWIENEIIGITCEHIDRHEGWKLLGVKESLQQDEQPNTKK